jgi:PHD/YefM family antitoxin component YafN of YafNO toxin-antitoxin module
MIYIAEGVTMPAIRPSADLGDHYNEISALCHEYSEPVFITKNGTGDLAVMSIEAYELLRGRLELYSLINEGLEQARNGKTKPVKESIKSIREKIK